MKIKNLFFGMIFTGFLSQAFAADVWNVDRCQNGENSILNVTIINQTSLPLVLTSTVCQNCGVELFDQGGTQKRMLAANGSAHYQTCGYHSGEQNNNTFVLSLFGAAEWGLSADLNFNNWADGTVWNIHNNNVPFTITAPSYQGDKRGRVTIAIIPKT